MLVVFTIGENDDFRKKTRSLVVFTIGENDDFRKKATFPYPRRGFLPRRDWKVPRETQIFSMNHRG